MLWLTECQPAPWQYYLVRACESRAEGSKQFNDSGAAVASDGVVRPDQGHAGSPANMLPHYSPQVCYKECTLLRLGQTQNRKKNKCQKDTILRPQWDESTAHKNSQSFPKPYLTAVCFDIVLFKRKRSPEFVHRCNCQSRHRGQCLHPEAPQNTEAHLQFPSSSQPFSSNPTGIKNMDSPQWPYFPFPWAPGVLELCNKLNKKNNKQLSDNGVALHSQDLSCFREFCTW